MTADTSLVWIDKGRNRKAQLSNGEMTFESRVIVEKILGRILPKTVIVHHVNGDALDNSNSNLVVCPDQAYHKLIHTRSEALEACSNANYKKCCICKIWDAPENMRGNNYFNSHTGYRAWQYIHRECNKERTRAWRARQRSLSC